MRATLEERLTGGGAAGGRRLVVLRELAGLAWAGVCARFRIGHATAALASESGTFGRRGRRGTWLLESTFQDLRFGARGIVRNPGFAMAVALVLALGIGANTAIFSAVNAVLLRPLPVPEPDRLVQVWEENPEKDWYKQVAAPANYLDWRGGVKAFEDVAAHSGVGTVTLTGVGSPELLRAAWVTGNFFEVLGVRALHGRGMRFEETWEEAQPVVVLSEGLWARLFGRDLSVVGRKLTLGDHSYEVIGVMPPGFAFPGDQLDVWLPQQWDPAARTQVWFRRAHFLSVIARLRDGVTQEQANAQLQVVVERLQRDYPETNRLMGAGITPLHEFLVGEAKTPLVILLGATALLLLLACANVANLMLVRATGRSRDVALRTALGAGRGRIVRQMLVEAVLLAGVGGAIGVGAGAAAIRALTALQPPGSLRLTDVTLDGRVLAFALAVTLASGILFGLVPALRGARIDAGATLKDGSRTTGGRGTRRVGQLLVVAEVALALLLVAGAGLLLRSFVALRQVDPGFEMEDRIAIALSLPEARYDDAAKIVAFVEQLSQRLGRLAGVNGVTHTSRLPMSGATWTSDFAIEGRGPDEYGSEIAHRPVAPNYFESFGVPVLRGRAFERGDQSSSEPVVVINETLARRFFPNEDPVGRRISFDRVPTDSSVWVRIVGVVGDEHQQGLHLPPRIEAFEIFGRAQMTWSFFYLVLQTSREPGALAESIRAELTAVDPLLPIVEIKKLEHVYAASLGRDRFLLTLIGTFAALALVLATVGVYGVTAEAARRRTQEIGIRVALGAKSGDVIRLILRQGLGLAAAGITVGLVGALAGSRLLSAVLFGISSRDAVTFIAVPGLLAVAAIVACGLPALRAARLDPVIALRNE
jgi:putative ABC transport system permease protein